MAQPLPYERDFDFAGFQSTHPSTPLPGDKVNLELDQVAETFNQIRERIRILQRDDLQLANQSVGWDQLKPELRNGFSTPTVWATGVDYAVGAAVYVGRKVYAALVAHKSVNFGVDLAAGKWYLLADFTAVTQVDQTAVEAAQQAIAAATAAQSSALAAAQTVAQSAANAQAAQNSATAAAASQTAAAGSASSASTSASNAATSASAAATSAANAATAGAAAGEAAAIAKITASIGDTIQAHSAVLDGISAPGGAGSAGLAVLAIDQIKAVNAKLGAFDTKAAAAAAQIDPTIDSIILFGYWAVGDGGIARYKRAASEPTHAGKLRSADGAWWELANQDLNVKMFGAKGDYGSHPLSAFFSSLTAAQVTFPSATSLTDELDRCAIQTAIDYINLRFGGELKITGGRYLIDKELILKRYVNLALDQNAELYAVKEFTNLISTPSVTSGLDAASYQSLKGGIFNGNNKVDQVVNFQNSNNINFEDFYIYDYKYHGLVLDKKGGHVIDHGQINSRENAAISVSTKTGILGDCADTHVSDVVIIGNRYGMRGKFYNSKIEKVHPWNTDTQGKLTEAFQLSGNDCVLVACQVDGPFQTAYAVYNTRVSLLGCSINYPANYGTFDNQDDIVYIDGAYKVAVIGCTWMIENPAQRIRYEFAGNLTNLIAMGNAGDNIVNPAPVSVTRRGSGSVINQMIAGSNISALNVGQTSTILSSSKGLFFNSADANALALQEDGAVDFPRIGTTSSAATAHLTTGNRLLRSTSSLRYKTDIEPMDGDRAEAILNLDPVWFRSTSKEDNPEFSWYGFIAEDVAKVDPRFVNWGYLPEDYESVEVLDEFGVCTGQTVKLREGAELVPDGVSYDRLTVPLLYLLKKSNKKIEDLEKRLRDLEIGRGT